jgi:Zn finger protein HypA/HybF involved in hydrogenase expression
MNNVKPLLECPECRIEGTVKEKVDIIVKLECPSCNLKWQTLTKTKGMKI